MNHNRLDFKHLLAPCKYFALLFVMLLPLTGFAQNVSGVITDANTGEEIIGATVKVKGTTTATVTDAMGNYSIAANTGQTLEISYIGYISQSVKVGNQRQIDIKLSEEDHSLNEVVVVGYGVMKRSDLTGAVASIDEKAIKQGVNTSIEQAMQGRISGVQVTQNSGAPGGGISVQIRGINSLSANEPLYIIDGIAVSGQTNGNSSALSALNPSDIISLEVLKDASATAIYGSRASNGVVLITTRRGQEGKTQVQYEGYVGWQQIPGKLDVMNLKEYASFYNDRGMLYGGEWAIRQDFMDPSLLTNGTDWQDVLFQTAFMHNHQVNVSGGSNSTKFSISGGFLDQDGIGIGSSFQRASFRANLDVNVNKWMSVGVNTSFSNTKRTVTFDESNVIQIALQQFPDVAPRNPDGSFGFNSDAADKFNVSYSNPLFEAEMRENDRKNFSLDYNFFANIFPVKGLNIRVEYGGSRGWNHTYQFQPDYQYGSTIMTSQSTRRVDKNEYSSFKQYATYDFDPLKGHHLQIMAGHEAQWGTWAFLSGSRKNYVSDTVHSLNAGDSNTATNDNNGNKWGIESYFGRLNYNLFDKYLLTATLRADGSSSFSKEKRWGWFPSVAAAWRINQENFLKDVKWLDNLKLRLGWGLVGNQQSGSFAYGSTLKAISTAWGTGFLPSNIGNPDLTWESTKAWNIGLDINLLGRIEFIVDAYLKKTDNLLMTAALPTYANMNSWLGMTAPWVNAGSIENKGIEFTLNTVNISKKDLQWRTGITLSINRNKLTKLNSTASAIQGVDSRNLTYTLSEIGGPVGRFYGYNVIGMFTREDDFYQKNSLGEYMLDANGDRLPVARPVATDGTMHPIQVDGIWVGDYIFEDVNKDGIINESDRKYIGDPNPDFTFGINNVITWKDFELSFFFNGSVGNDIYNYIKERHTNYLNWGNYLSSVANYARVELIDPNGVGTDISNVYVPNASTAEGQRINPARTNLNENNRVSNRFIEDGSYIRLKSLSLAWNLPKKWLKPVQLDWVQVYVNAQNLFTISGYDGYDPEIGAVNQSVIMQGLDIYRYPSQRIYNVGLKVRF
jgi:TonB-linked SusC/RagA family outer membrane protein